MGFFSQEYFKANILHKLEPPTTLEPVTIKNEEIMSVKD